MSHDQHQQCRECLHTQYVRLRPGARLIITTPSVNNPAPRRPTEWKKDKPMPLWDSDLDDEDPVPSKPAPHKQASDNEWKEGEQIPLWDSDSDNDPEIKEDVYKHKPVAHSEMLPAWSKVPSVSDLASSWPNDDQNIPVFAVTRGWQVGIFVSWKTTQHFVSYVYAPMYKKCPSLATAIEWWTQCLNEKDKELCPKVLEHLMTAPPCPIIPQTAMWAGDSLIVESSEGLDLGSHSGLAKLTPAHGPTTSGLYSVPTSAPTTPHSTHTADFSTPTAQALVTPRSSCVLIHIHESDSETNDEYGQHFDSNFSVSELADLDQAEQNELSKYIAS
ncbi:hypothetical protein D9758_007394 [Tetrapyrgos nigripes]|uniref:Ribonuclease H1 N-terminal domain-containing protein n=1 Tax=Tetrapyrgos nigripes TaxID=182062 RepID=A0A8H5LLH0_9AGAR|nr:hypothetical protein D9758_007394 [Tetrapyrgos nigripes]